MNTQKITSKRNNSRKKRNNKLFIPFMLILILLAGFLLYINRGNPTIGGLLKKFTNSGGYTKPTITTLNTGIQFQYEIYKDNIVLFNKDGIKAINHKGQDEWSIGLQLRDPLVQTNGKYILVADKGGRSASIISNYKIERSIPTEEPILMVKINETGYCGIVTEEKGHKGKIIVYNPSGKELFRWHSGNNYITDLDISADGKRMAAATLDASKDKVAGGVVFFDLSAGKTDAGKAIENSIISNLRFYKDNRLVAVTDTQVVGFSSKGQQSWNYDYAGKKLLTANIKSNDYIVLGLSDNQGQGFLNNPSVVEIINKQGKKNGSYNVNGEVSIIDVMDDTIAINSKRDLYTINADGHELFKTGASRDVKQMLLFQNKKDIMVASRSGVDILNISR